MIPCFEKKFRTLKVWLIVVLCSGAPLVKASGAQWPAGMNVCEGTWSYSEYDSCEHSSHGLDTNNPIIAESDGAKCGYEQMPNSCWHGRETRPNSFVDTPSERLTSIDRPWRDTDFKSHCDRKASALALQPGQLLGTVSVLSAQIRGKVCTDFEGRDCMIWQHRADVQCRINIDYQTFGPSDACGAYVDNPLRPKSCTIGYRNINKRSSACSSRSLTTGRKTDASSLMTESWRYGFACSTGDDMPVSTRAEVQKKYAFYTKRIQELDGPTNPDFPLLIKGLETLVKEKSIDLDASQLAYAEKVVSSEIRSSKITSGTAFHAEADCVAYSPGRSRFCPSKRLLFDFGDITHLFQITPYTSLAHKLKYTFACSIDNKALTVRLIEGDDVYSLAPTFDGTLQSTSVLFKSGSRPPQIELLADRSALFPDTCRLDIVASSLDLDPTLLLSSSNVLMSKIKLLANFKTQLDSAAQLPTMYNTVQTLKSRLDDQIFEDAFKCQDLAGTLGRDADSLCPLDETPEQRCLNPRPAESGELGVIMDRLHQNSCLYSELEKGLPTTVSCNQETNGSFCLAGVKKVAELAEREYQKSLGSAKRLVDALTIEKLRVSAQQADLARRIGIVVESLNNGLGDTTISPSPLPDTQMPSQPEASTPRVIYDGETASFSAGQGWDISQSTVIESNLKPFSGTRHLRFIINNQNYWGAAAYVWANYAPLDISKFRKLTFQARADGKVSIKVFLVSMETNSETNYLDFDLSENYQAVSIDLDRLKKEGFDLASPQALVIATSLDSETTYLIDVDNLTLTP